VTAASGVMRRAGSIRFRLTALFVAILAVTLVFFSFLLFNVFVREQHSQFDVALYNHAVDVGNGVEVGLFGELTINNEMLSNGVKIFPFAVGRSFLQLLTPEGNIIARSRALGQQSLPFTGEDLRETFRKGYVFQTIRSSKILPSLPEGSYRVLAYLVQKPGNTTFILQIAVPMSPLELEQKGLLTFFFLAIPLTLLVASVGGLYLSRKALAPVLDIIEKARRLSASSLSERLPVPPHEDELSQLSLTLNALLDRLQQAFESQERFIADASHQLKTPLAILRGELDVLKSRPRTNGEIEEFLKSASQELDRLGHLVEDLLTLARADAGAGSLLSRKIRLDEVALEAVSRVEFLAKSRQVKIRFDLLGDASGDFEILGDADLLRSMLQNLLDNAIKYSPQGSTVEVQVQDATDAVAVRIKDAGPGIPEELLPKVFERFFRTQAEVPGFGLGLAIAKRIVEAHQGTLNVQSQVDKGTTFTVRIKKV